MPAAQRQRQGIVPDFVFTLPRTEDGAEAEHIFELKTLHVAPSTYAANATERCAAVSKRADALSGEYFTKARRLDRRFSGTVGDDVGPVEARLRRFEEVRGVVFGAWGEASPGAEALLHACADAGAQRH